MAGIAAVGRHDPELEPAVDGDGVHRRLVGFLVDRDLPDERDAFAVGGELRIRDLHDVVEVGGFDGVDALACSWAAQ